MRIPNCINRNILKTYETFGDDDGTLKSWDFREWDINLPKSLEDICVEVIAKHWAENPILEEILQPSNKYHLLEIFSTDLPLTLTITKINYDVYWRRCYVERWPRNLPHRVKKLEDHQVLKSEDNRKNSVKNDENSCETSRKNSIGEVTESRERTWKELFVEMHVKTYLEKLKPEEYDPEKLKELSDLCTPYVKTLKIEEIQSATNSPNRIPLNSVLTGFQNLQELSLCFKQTYIGENFTWNVIRTSQQDIKLLTKGLEKLRLKVLRILNSDIDGPKSRLILKSILKHDINILDFSNCKISDEGMMAISKYCFEVPVTEIILTNNQIGRKGAEAFSYSLLQSNCKICKLDLRLNRIGNEGANYLTGALEDHGKTLKFLSIPGCTLTKNISFERLIYKNKTLETFDISNNPVGEYVGQEMLEAIKYNTTLKKIDLRMCQVSSETEFSIHELLEENRKGKRRVLARSPFRQEGEDYNFQNDDLINEINTIFDLEN